MNIDIKNIKKTNVEINSKKYPVASRTLAIEKQIDEIQERDDTVYEREKSMISLLIGEDGFNEIFPTEDDTNMDFLEMVYLGCLEAFDFNKNERNKKIEEEQAKKVASQLKPITDQTARLLPAIEAMNRQQKRALNSVK